MQPARGEDAQRWAARSLATLAGVAASLMLELWSLSWRRDTSELLRLDDRIERGEKILAVFWHGKYFPLFALARGRGAAVLTNDSFRGQVIARICRWFGYRAVQIPQNQGKDALAVFEGALTGKSFLAAMAVDGPSGPYRRAKAGAVRVASRQGLRIVPVSMASRPKRIVRGRWDRHEIPFPFARVKMLVGEPIDVPAGLDDAQIPEWREKLQERMDALETRARAERWNAAAPG